MRPTRHRKTAFCRGLPTTSEGPVWLRFVVADSQPAFRHLRKTEPDRSAGFRWVIAFWIARKSSDSTQRMHGGRSRRINSRAAYRAERFSAKQPARWRTTSPNRGSLNAQAAWGEGRVSAAHSSLGKRSPAYGLGIGNSH